MACLTQELVVADFGVWSPDEIQRVVPEEVLGETPAVVLEMSPEGGPEEEDPKKGLVGS